MTALTALLAGLATAVGVLALLTRGVLTTLLAAVTLIFLAAVLTAALVLATLVLLAALVLTTLAPTLLLSTVLSALVLLLITILIHEGFSLVLDTYVNYRTKGCVPARSQDAINFRMPS